MKRIIIILAFLCPALMWGQTVDRCGGVNLTSSRVPVANGTDCVIDGRIQDLGGTGNMTLGAGTNINQLLVNTNRMQVDLTEVTPGQTGFVINNSTAEPYFLFYQEVISAFCALLMMA